MVAAEIRGSSLTSSKTLPGASLREKEGEEGHPDQDQKAMTKPPAQVSHGGMVSHIPTRT